MGAGFDDGKESGAFRTIGELALALGLKPHVLRYWEQHFPTLQPLKRSGGRRYYRPEDVALVGQIDRLVNREGYTLKGAMKALSGKTIPAGEGGAQPAAELPLDGGLETFFGRPPAAGTSGGGEAAGAGAGGEAAGNPADLAHPPTAEMVARLKSIRERLADALKS